MTLLERLDVRWERMDGAAATKIDRILVERRDAAAEIRKMMAEMKAMQVRLDRWEPKLTVSSALSQSAQKFTDRT